MSHDVSAPPVQDDPVVAALQDPDVRARMLNAARAVLSRRMAGMLVTQREKEAEVLFQSASLRALEIRDAYDGSRDVANWLAGIVTMVARESLRRRAREKTGPPPGGAPLDEVAVDRSAPVDEQVVARLLTRDLLGRLPELERTILQLKYEGGLTCAEIAQRVGIRTATVQVRVHRAIQKLKQLCGVAGEGQP
jgi:RNA polymerase sigma factor (sigma-70 family)